MLRSRSRRSCRWATLATTTRARSTTITAMGQSTLTSVATDRSTTAAVAAIGSSAPRTSSSAVLPMGVRQGTGARRCRRSTVLAHRRAAPAACPLPRGRLHSCQDQNASNATGSLGSASTSCTSPSLDAEQQHLVELEPSPVALTERPVEGGSPILARRGRRSAATRTCRPSPSAGGRGTRRSPPGHDTSQPLLLPRGRPRRRLRRRRRAARSRRLRANASKMPRTSAVVLSRRHVPPPTARSARTRGAAAHR